MSDKQSPESRACPHCKRPLDVDPMDDPPDEKQPRHEAPKFDNPDIRQAILDSIEAGNEMAQAAASVDVTPRMIQKWLAKGRDQLARRRRGKWRDFLEACELAALKCEERNVSIVANDAIENPESAKFILERKFAARWSHKSTVMVVRQDRETIRQTVFMEFASEPEIIERFLRALIAAETGGQRQGLAAGVVQAEPGAGETVEGEVTGGSAPASGLSGEDESPLHEAEAPDASSEPPGEDGEG